MPEALSFARFPLEFKAADGLVVGYANKAIVDNGNDYIPPDVWLGALQTFFAQGAPVKLLHRPGLVVGETAWLKVAEDGLVLASYPIPEVRPLIERGILRAYSVGFIPREVEYRADGVREIRALDLYEVSYVDAPMNPGCYFTLEKMAMNHEVVFDRERGVVTILGVNPEEMGRIAATIKELLVKAGVPEGAPLSAIEFKAAAEPQPPTPPDLATDEELEYVDWSKVLTGHYQALAGEVPEEKARWTRRFINRLPDSSFAVIEPAYERGETQDKNCRHLPHHGPGGGGTENVNLDLPHLRNALARASQIVPVTDSITAEELRRKAQAHLEHHRSALEGAKVEHEEDLTQKVQKLAAAVSEATAMQAAVQKAEEGLAEVKGAMGAFEARIAELAQGLAEQKAALAELRSALGTLIDVVQSVIPPQRSRPVLDTAEPPKDYKWGIFKR